MDEVASGVGVYSTAEVLRSHLKSGRAEVGEVSYWTFKRMPNWVTPGGFCDFWIAFDNRWQGFFHIEDVDFKRKQISFHSNSFHQLLEPLIKRAPFKGFTYNVPAGNLLVKCGNNVEHVVVSKGGVGGHAIVGSLERLKEESVSGKSANTKRARPPNGDQVFGEGMTRRLALIQDEIRASREIILRQMSIYDEGQAKAIGQSLKRIEFLLEVQLFLPRLVTMKTREAKKALTQFLERHFSKEEVRQNERMIEGVVEYLESQRRIVYRSASPDSKNDVA